MLASFPMQDLNGHTNWGEHELVQSHALERGHHSGSFAHGESPCKEAKPLMLYGRHQETIRHEPCQALEIKGRRQQLRVGDEITVVQRVPPVDFVDLDGQEIIFVALAHRTLPHCGQRLGYCVRYTTQHLQIYQRMSFICLRSEMYEPSGFEGSKIRSGASEVCIGEGVIQRW